MAVCFCCVFVLFISVRIIVKVVAEGKSQAVIIRLRDLCVRWSFLGGVFF